MCTLFILTSLFKHCSVLYSITLAILRTIDIYYPFYRANKRVVACNLAVLPLIYLAVTIYELYFYRSESYFALFSYLVIFPAVGASITWSVSMRLEEHHLNPLPEYSHVIVSLLVPFVIPSLVSIVCCVLQAKRLLRKKEIKMTGSKENQSQQRNITLTILLLTITFFVCNTTFFTTALTLILGMNNWEQRYEKIVSLMYFTSTILPFMNSLVNPLIFLARGARLRLYLYRNYVYARTYVFGSLYTLRNTIKIRTTLQTIP